MLAHSMLTCTHACTHIRTHPCTQAHHAVCWWLAGECIDAVSGELTFFTLPNCFELFGFDLMVDDCWRVWLLEVCPCPCLLLPTSLFHLALVPLNVEPFCVCFVCAPAPAPALPLPRPCVPSCLFKPGSPECSAICTCPCICTCPALALLLHHPYNILPW